MADNQSKTNRELASILEFDINGDFNQDTNIFIKEEPVVADSCHHENPIKTDCESHEYIDCDGKSVSQAGENILSCLNLDSIKQENLEENSSFSSNINQDLKPNVSNDFTYLLDSEMCVIKKSQCDVKKEGNSSFQQDESVTGLGFNDDRFEICDSQKKVVTKFEGSAKCNCYQKKQDTNFDRKPDINVLEKSEVDDNADSDKADIHLLTSEDTDWNKSFTTDNLQAKQNDQNTCTKVEESCDSCALLIKESLSKNEDSLIEKQQGITILSNSHIFGANDDLFSESSSSVHTSYSQPDTEISCIISRQIAKQINSQSKLTKKEIQHTRLQQHEMTQKCLKPFKCSECPKCFSRKHDLTRHENRHKGLKPFKCLECSECFSVKSSLKQHERIHQGLYPFKCTECSKCFTRKHHLMDHERIHKGLKPFKCSECSKCFNVKQNLTVHERIHKDLKPFKCSECSKCFNIKQNLMVHERIHKGLQPFNCSECSKCFTRKHHLMNHERLHKGLRPFKCSECSKCFNRKQSLTAHQNNHKGLKPFKCSECSKCFSRKPGLTRHENIHKGLKPFKCSECSKCFTQKQNLKAHEKLHQDLMPF